MDRGYSSADRRLTTLGERSILIIVLGVAMLLRLPLTGFELFHHPDEVWQYLEPAHGIVTGHAIVPWEYRAGIRTWLIPSLLVPPMALGKAIWPDSILYLVPVRLVLAILSLAIVGFGTALALRISRWHGLVVGLALAVGFDLVYFSARALSDSVAPALFLPAAWLLLAPGSLSTRRLLAGGVLLGLCFAIRFQLAPALGILALFACRGRLRCWGWVIAGGLAGLAVDGLVDLSQGEVPFRWIVENFRINLVENKSAFYGVQAPGWYAGNQLRVWGFAAPVLLGLALLGARRMPVLLVVAIANVAAHMAIPHKEYRFIYLSIVLLWLLAGLGAGDATIWLARRWGRIRRGHMWAMLIVLGLAVDGAIALAPGHDVWSGGRRTIRVMRAAHDAPGACGLAFLQPLGALSASYVYYDRATPIYVFDGDEAHRDIRRFGGGFNVVITSPDRAAMLLPGYRRIDCFFSRQDRQRSRLEPLPASCVFVRPGGCGQRLPARFGMNAAMIRHGE